MKLSWKLSILIVCLVLAVGAFAKNAANEDSVDKSGEKIEYRWPLNINNGYSSAFQEFRSTHFHGGMDFRTFQKNGYPVYAIADGVIYNIRMVKRGSGRGLYLKHDDGNVSIYFHLNRFEKKLEDLLKRVQHIKKKKYIGNYYLKKPLRYKRGQLIAYSGETGSGFPHLHLEIRDKDQFALNPFKLVKFVAKDKNYPVLKGLLLRNRQQSSINGSIGETYIKFDRLRRGSYRAREHLVLTGDLDITLCAYDISDTGRHAAPYEISVSIDNSRYYHLRFDRFQRDDNNQLGFVYDMHYSNAGTYYFNLFSQEGFALERENKSLSELISLLEYGKHQLTVRVADNFGNSSSGDLTFYKVRTPEFQVTELVKQSSNTTGGGNGDPKDGNQFQVQMNLRKLNSTPEGEIKLYVYDRNGTKISSGVLNYTQLPEPRQFILKGVSPDAAYLDFVFFAHNVRYYKKRMLLDEQHLTGITDVMISTYVNRDEVFVKIENPELAAENVELKLIQDGETRLLNPQCSENEVYFCFKPEGLKGNKPVLLNFAVKKDNRTVVEVQKTLHLIYLKKGIKRKYRFHEFEADFAVRSVYEPRVLKVEETAYQSEFPIESRQVDLSPYHFPFLDTVYYKFKKKLEKPEQVGIFMYKHKSGKWGYRFTQYDPETTTYRHRLRSSGVFALMRDIFPPKITFSHSGTKYKKSFKRIVVKITDKGKGVDDNTIKIWLNGKRICTNYNCEYDPDRSWLILDDLRYLKTGKNSIKVLVKDYAGNSSSRSLSFYLK
jgi:hypothetical protein